ncbi:MAG: hypothetical protein RI947_1244 [Candidatus Parcubacteria bacterium]|jgi:hypothetical protein
MTRDRDDIEQILIEIAATHPICTLGKMMGHKAVYINRKLALCAFDDGMVVKVPKEKHQEVVDSNEDCVDFAPSGHRMTGRIILTLENAEDYLHHPLVHESLRLTALEASKK